MDQCVQWSVAIGGSGGGARNAVLQNVDVPVGSLLQEIKWCTAWYGGKEVLGGLQFIYAGDPNGYWDNVQCSDYTSSVAVPHSPVLEYKGHYANTSCCPLAAGFKLRFADGTKLLIGITTSPRTDAAY